MSTVEFSVRLLSGEIHKFDVEPDTPLSGIKAQLDEGLPRFHEVQLFLGERKLSNGTIVETGITSGTTVQAVTTGSLDMALAEIKKLQRFFHSEFGLIDGPRVLPACEFIVTLEDHIDKPEYDAIWKEFGSIFMSSNPCFYTSSSSMLLFLNFMFRLMGNFADMSAVGFLNYWSKQIQIRIPYNNLRDLKSALELARVSVDKIASRHSHKVPQAEPALGVPMMQAEANAAGDDTVQPLSEELEIAIRESTTEAITQEGAHVQEALLRSKIDAAQRQQLVVLRLTKRNSQVLDAMLTIPCLQQVRSQVEEAGCEILPDWADGAVLLAPLTEQQALEAGVKFRAHHIVVAQQDQASVEGVLATIPKRRRPGVQFAKDEHLLASSSAKMISEADHTNLEKLSLQPYTQNVDVWDGAWVVEKTFVQCSLPEDSQSSCDAHSEPWGGDLDVRPTKMLRLSSK